MTRWSIWYAEECVMCELIKYLIFKFTGCVAVCVSGVVECVPETYVA